jgi:putative redox protein
MALMKITTNMVGDEVFEAVNDNGNKVIIDMRKREVKTSQSPVELLLSALAACGGVDVVVILKKRKKNILNFTIETEGTRHEDPPRYFTKIHCRYIVTSPDVTEEELHKAAAIALEKYCSVAASLKAEITISAHVICP